MDANRIAELEEEYTQNLMEDLAHLREALETFDDTDMGAQLRDEVLSTELSPDNREALWLVCRCFSSAPLFEERFQKAYGRDSHIRLYWAHSHFGEGRYEQYLDWHCYLPRGDYYITDPCYIAKEDDWNEGLWGSDDMSDLGIPTSFMRDTIFGDWGCTLRDSWTDEVIGTFGADAGMVVVARKDEVDAYNPDFEKWAEEHDWCVALLRDFEGALVFRVTEEPYEDFGGGISYELVLEFDGTDSDGNGRRFIAGMF